MQNESWTNKGRRGIQLLHYLANDAGYKGKRKGAYALDIAPLCSESPPQKCSGMPRVLKGFHSFTCTPTRSSAIGMSPAFAFPAAAGTHLPSPEGWKAE